MTANRTTTDSEMATTDHTFGRPLAGPGRTAAHTPTCTILPPTGPAYPSRDESPSPLSRQADPQSAYFGHEVRVTGW
ncbi:hypothetical protein Slala05_06480 [Streptomyces lavendulae subsp. lavendulae]|nr:hypothetical protein Slala05_06480 [Streptomyces lavendulae subsp. lavendulae]